MRAGPSRAAVPGPPTRRPAQGGRPRRRHGPVRLARCPPPDHRRPHRRRHRGRRRRLQRTPARRAGRTAARRPAQGAGRAVRRRRLGPDLGPGHPAPLPVQGRPARARRRQPPDRRPLGTARRSRPGPRPGRQAARRARAGAAHVRRTPGTAGTGQGPSPGAARGRRDRARTGDRGADARRGAVRAPRAARPAGRPRGRRGGPGRRLGGSRPGLLVLLGHPAPPRARFAGRAHRDQGAPGAPAEPGPAARRNRRLLTAASFGGFGTTRP